MKYYKITEKDKQRVIKDLIKSDVGYYKLELEGNTNDSYSDDYCDYCEEGQQTCSNCDGYGEVTAYDNNSNEYPDLTCVECEGDGRLECVECGGDYEGGDSYEVFTDRLKEKISTTSPITHIHSYRDGSVNMETTVTLEVSEIGIRVGIELIEAFNSMIDDTSGAGFHISVLPKESNGYYPAQAIFDPIRIENFKKQMSKLMPALYFMGTDGYNTRPLMPFREPNVTTHKYSAVHLVDYGSGGGACAIEYRVFDTCYDKPEHLWFNLSVIAKSLKFYRNKTAKVDIPKAQVQGLHPNKIGQLFRTVSSYDALMKSWKYLAPNGYTLEQLKKERGMASFNEDYVSKLRFKEEAKLRNKFFEQKAGFEVRIRHSSDTYTRERATQQLTDLLERGLENFINNNMPSLRSIN